MFQWMRKTYESCVDQFYLWKRGSAYLYDTVIPRAFHDTTQITTVSGNYKLLKWLGLPSFNLLIIADKSLAGQAIMKADSIAGTRTVYRKFAEMIQDPEVLIYLSGEEGKVARSLIKPFTSLPYINKMIEERADRLKDRRHLLISLPSQTSQFIDKAFRQAAHCQHGAIDELVTQACLEVIAKILLGTSDLPPDFGLLADEVDRVMKIGNDQSDEFKQVKSRILETSHAFIEKHLLEIKGNDSYLRSKIESTLGKTITEASDAEIKDALLSSACLGLLVAATNITQIILTALIETIKRPELLERLREELAHAAEKKVSLEPSQIQKVFKEEYPILHSIYWETLRYRSMVPSIVRYFQESVVIEDLEIPAQTLVIVPVKAMSHDPIIYPNPEHFDPDRFLVRQEPLPQYVFSAGTRRCPAEAYYAPAMFIAAMQTLMGNYEIRLDKDYPLEPWLTAYSHYEKSVQASISLRNQAEEVNPEVGCDAARFEIH